MSDSNMARRADVEITFDGTDITGSILPYLLSVVYTDNEEDETDDLQIKLQDRDGIWLTKWLNDAVDAAAASAGPSTVLKIQCVIVRKNWNGDGSDLVLDCGQFELDTVDLSGPPAVVVLKATSLPFSSQIRQTEKSRAWESYTLSGIAAEMAASSGMACLYESAGDPFYERAEQYKTSDIAFLSALCHDAGISLKATGNILVLFDQADYEAKGTVLTLKRGSGAYTKYKLDISSADTLYASCRVSYSDPATGVCVEGTAFVEDFDASAKNNQQLEVTAKVNTAAEAKVLAEKHLRLHNKYTRTATFTIPGNPNVVAGVTVALEDWGGWTGKYLVSQARHSVDGSGYTTQIRLRRVLEGY